jgi:hypothetical protein
VVETQEVLHDECICSIFESDSVIPIEELMTLDVYSAVFDSDLDAVAERLGKAAEDWLRTRTPKVASLDPKECSDRESLVSPARIVTV